MAKLPGWGPQQQPIQNTRYPAAGQGVILDLNGKLPTSVLPRIVTGIVAGAGTVTAGTGFTVVRNSAGNYTVTFTAAFTAAPVVLAATTDATAGVTTVGTVTATGFVVTITGAVDRPFNFVAYTVL